MKFFTAIAALIVAAAVNAQASFSNCAPPTADMTVTTFSLSPYPLCIGKVCITVTGTLHAPIVYPADLSIIGKYLGRIVYIDNYDLCTLFAASGQFCPVATTATSINACVLVKSTFPVNVPVALTIRSTNGSGNTLFCQTAGVTAYNC